MPLVINKDKDTSVCRQSFTDISKVKRFNIHIEYLVYVTRAN